MPKKKSLPSEQPPMTKRKKPRIDPRVTWITRTEAMRAWGIKSRSTITWAYWRNHVMMRKSAGIWIVFVPDMIKWFGDPKESLVIRD